MIDFQEANLKNGLKIIVHTDSTTPIVAFNLTYNVGARDEDPKRTGFAHLFEHLMFGGSINIPSFDKPLQSVGGENNAFTTNDITNYYITLPKNSLETAFWLESDRMLSLAFSQKSLDVQRNVVIEEFNQRYLNQPYGDAYLLLRPLAYQKHPYQWATIGKSISHIKYAKMQEVKNFFKKYYVPNNAVLSVAGNVTIKEIELLSEKWFGDIPMNPIPKRTYPVEPKQTEKRTLTVYRDVPLNALYKSYHMVARSHPDYYAFDLLSDILSSGNSSRFYRHLIKGKKLFTEVNAYIGGDIDPGLFTMTAHLNPGVGLETAEEALLIELKAIQLGDFSDEELHKVKNRMLMSHEFGQISILNKAMSLGIAAIIDKPELVNEEIIKYQAVTKEDIQRIAQTYLIEKNSVCLYYLAKNNSNE